MKFELRFDRLLEIFQDADKVDWDCTTNVIVDDAVVDRVVDVRPVTVVHAVGVISGVRPAAVVIAVGVMGGVRLGAVVAAAVGDGGVRPAAVVVAVGGISGVRLADDVAAAVVATAVVVGGD